MSEQEKTVQTFLERMQASKPKLQAIETATLGTVFIRRQTGEDQLKVYALGDLIGVGKLAALPESVFAAVMGAIMFLNEDGTQLFADAKQGYETLNACGADELRELYKVIMKVTRPTSAKDIEEAEKKSSSSQSEESGTN